MKNNSEIEDKNINESDNAKQDVSERTTENTSFESYNNENMDEPSDVEDGELGDDFVKFDDAESDNPGGAPDQKETKLKRAMDVFGCLFAINICFVISCLPIFTIGASFAALYAMMFRIQRRDDYTVVKEYFQEFKRNFKKGTAAWFLIILACVAIWGEYLYFVNFDNAMSRIYEVVIIFEVVALALVLPFLFPLIAYFDNTLVNTFKNSFLLAVSNFGSWLKMFVAWFAVIAFGFGYEFIFLNTWYLWLLLMFGLLAYGTSLTAKKVFDHVAVAQTEKAEREESGEETQKPKKKSLFKKKEKEEKDQKSIKDKLAVMNQVNGIKESNESTDKE